MVTRCIPGGSGQKYTVVKYKSKHCFRAVDVETDLRIAHSTFATWVQRGNIESYQVDPWSRKWPPDWEIKRWVRLIPEDAAAAAALRAWDRKPHRGRRTEHLPGWALWSIREGWSEQVIEETRRIRRATRLLLIPRQATPQRPWEARQNGQPTLHSCPAPLWPAKSPSRLR